MVRQITVIKNYLSAMVLIVKARTIKSKVVLLGSLALKRTRSTTSSSVTAIQKAADSPSRLLLQVRPVSPLPLVATVATIAMPGKEQTKLSKKFGHYLCALVET